MKIVDLEAKIESLRETQRKYNGVLRLSSALAAQLGAAQHTQRALGDAFADLAQKSPELQNQCVPHLFPSFWSLEDVSHDQCAGSCTTRTRSAR